MVRTLLHETSVYQMDEEWMWCVACEGCGWEDYYHSYLSAMVASDHHQVMMQRQKEPRDRLLFLRVQIPHGVSENRAKTEIVRALNIHSRIRVTAIPFIG